LTTYPSEILSTLPGCHESKEIDSSLNEVLDSLIPYLRDPSTTIPLPIVLGKSLDKDLSHDNAPSTSRPVESGTREEFAWSRGLSIEYSSIKTCSARKNVSSSSSQQPVTDSPSTDYGELRAVKSLAWEK